jgi:hypothetical protein
MSIRRASKSSISATTTRGKGSNLLAGYSPAVDEMDLIQRVTVGTAVTSITLSNIPQTYQHLHLRVYGQLTSTQQGVWTRFNSDSAANYSCHFLYGNGASAIGASRLSDGGIDAIVVWDNDDWFIGVIDILDYASTTKLKTVRSISGADSNGAGIISLGSGSWRNTSGITTIHLSDQIAGGSFAQNTVASLYGVIG